MTPAKNTTSTIVLGVRDDIAEGKSGSIQLGVVPSTRPLARPAADSAVTPRGADHRRRRARQRRGHEPVPRAEPQGGVNSGDRR